MPAQIGAPCHHASTCRAAVQQRPLNPIEMAFSKLKAHLRRLEARSFENSHFGARSDSHLFASLTSVAAASAELGHGLRSVRCRSGQATTMPSAT
jgi:hypothetical protein